MKVDSLDRMVRGWFVGDFEPTLFRTRDVEVAVKHYDPGERDERHHHKVATELTVLVSGSARMAGRTLEAGEIVVVEPGESSDFEALTSATVVAVKIPGAPGDKYVDGEAGG